MEETPLGLTRKGSGSEQRTGRPGAEEAGMRVLPRSTLPCAARLILLAASRGSLGFDLSGEFLSGNCHQLVIAVCLNLLLPTVGGVHVLTN